MPSSTSSGASSIRGRPGASASPMPAMTRSIDGAVLSRRATMATTTSTASKSNIVWIVAVMAHTMLNQCCGRQCLGLSNFEWTVIPHGEPESLQTLMTACEASPGENELPEELSSEIHRRAHEIALAELDSAMAQDVVRCCAVKIEVWQDEILQQRLPRELALVGAELDGDVLVLGAVDLRRLKGFAVVDRLGEARLELGKACFRVGHVRHLGAGKRATTSGGVSARLLHLARIWIHVGKEPHVEKKVGVELLCLNMRYRLVDTLRLGGQKLHEDRHRHLVHGNRHGMRSSPGQNSEQAWNDSRRQSSQEARAGPCRPSAFCREDDGATMLSQHASTSGRRPGPGEG